MLILETVAINPEKSVSCHNHWRMKSFSQHIIWLLLCCIIASSAAPFFCQKRIVTNEIAAFNVNNASLPAQGKEEKNELFKFHKLLLVITNQNFREKNTKLNYECPSRLTSQMNISVLLPPPKFSA
jgi:hypothetical protein